MTASVTVIFHCPDNLDQQIPASHHSYPRADLSNAARSL